MTETCPKCGKPIYVWSQYDEMKGFCSDPDCDTVLELGPDPEW